MKNDNKMIVNSDRFQAMFFTKRNENNQTHTLRSETFAGRNFRGSAQPRNFCISREKTFADDLFLNNSREKTFAVNPIQYISREKTFAGKKIFVFL